MSRHLKKKLFTFMLTRLFFLQNGSSTSGTREPLFSDHILLLSIAVLFYGGARIQECGPLETTLAQKEFSSREKSPVALFPLFPF